VTTVLANGNVQFAGNTNQFIRPYSKTVKYDKVLPNVGASYHFTDNHSVYGNYAEGLSVPRTDNLYTITRAADGSLQNPGVQPETTKTFDVGYRYQSANVQLELSAFYTRFQNRIASSFDQDLNVFIDRNIGAATIKGVDAGAVWRMTEDVTLTGNISYLDSEVKSNSPLGVGLFLPIAGKKIVETPDWESFQRIDWHATDLITVGIQNKYVGKRFSTDVNDQFAKAYNTIDADVRIRLPVWSDHNVYFQANVKNIADTHYLGSISSQTNAITVPGSTGFAPTYVPGSPRTYEFTLHADF
jgi:iron complex outermembrane receptor protein